MDILMDSDAQRLYINSMLSSPELFARVNHMVKPEYFDSGMKGHVSFIKEYFQENRAVPAAPIFKAATKSSPELFEIQRQDIQFLAEQIAGFCQASEMIRVLRSGPELLESRDYNKLIEQFKSASQIGLLEELGIEYFNDPLLRLETTEQQKDLISTGWADVDELIGGGVGREELILFLAPSGGGKSVNMANLSYNFMKQGLHGVYISIEMRDTKIANRFDQMIAGFGGSDIQQNRAKVAHEVEMFGQTAGRLFIKRMRESVTNANHVSAYLQQLEASKGFKPDFIVLDYLDIMQSARKVDGSNMFLKDQYVSEEARALGFDHKCIVVSGSQLEKGATDKINDGQKMHQGNVQGGSSKTNTADLMIATVKTDAMHEAGEYRFEFIKARNSDATGKSCMMKFNKKTLRVTDGSAAELTLNKKPKLEVPQVTPGAKPKSLAELTKKFD